MNSEIPMETGISCECQVSNPHVEAGTRWMDFSRHAFAFGSHNDLVQQILLPRLQYRSRYDWHLLQLRDKEHQGSCQTHEV